MVIETPSELEEASPMVLKFVLDRHGLGRECGKSLFITHNEREDLAGAFAELPREGLTLPWWDVDVKDLLGMGKIVIEKNALQAFLKAHRTSDRKR
jgi:large subunit ribosomal protein L4